jgi:two-component system, NtrC family, response regulator AtoC
VPSASGALLTVWDETCNLGLGRAFDLEPIVTTSTPPHDALPPLDILLVEDEPDILEALEEVLREHGHKVTTACDGAQAMSQLDARCFDLAICDVRLPKVDGMKIFRRIRNDAPDSHVILMSAYGTVAEAVDAIKEKAAHYLAKPFRVETMLELVERIAHEHQLKRSLTRAHEDREEQPVLIGSSPSVHRLRQKIQAIAKSDAAVLITGESGTGKELVVRLLHQASDRASGPLVAVNCAAFPETLLEAELFGHEKGAFTGAHARREGRFRAANGGTLFLDEVADMSPAAQAKLLRALEDGSYQPIGSDTTIRVDVRIVSATNIDIKKAVEDGRFREDIFHRLKVFQLHVPPLRERRGDLPVLIEHFRRRVSPHATEPLRIAPRAWAALRAYPFPGNIRELKHMVEHALVMSGGGEIDVEHLPDEIRGEPSADPRVKASVRPLGEATEEFEREYIKSALRRYGWRRTHTANVLGISRKTLWQKMRMLGIGDDENPDLL